MAKQWPTLETIPLVHLENGESLQIGMCIYRLVRFDYPGDTNPRLDDFVDLILKKDEFYAAKNPVYDIRSMVVRLKRDATVRRLMATRIPAEAEETE